jgi:CheY-like chemotaxis protein
MAAAASADLAVAASTHRRGGGAAYDEGSPHNRQSRAIKFYASTHADQHISCDPGGVALRCLIVDDRPSFLEAARELLEAQGLTIVGCASSAAEALRSVRELRPEVALVDIDLGPDSGFDLARRLAADADGNAPRVILVSTHDEREFVKLIESSPAVGFLAKTELSAERIYQLLEHADG